MGEDYLSSGLYYGGPFQALSRKDLKEVLRVIHEPQIGVPLELKVRGSSQDGTMIVYPLAPPFDIIEPSGQPTPRRDVPVSIVRHIVDLIRYIRNKIN